MNKDIIDQFHEKWVKVSHLLVDLSSLEIGFKDMEKDRRAIWDYIEWRETVLVGPPDAGCRDATLI